MSATWTIERILALAVDASVRRASLKLATANEWTSLRRAADELQGEIREGQRVHHVQVNLNGTRFACTCAARKRPCKHSLALLLRAVQQPGSITSEREAAGRARLERAAAGLRELSLWLRDRVRSGLSELHHPTCAAWETIVARMIDADAPGIAARLRQLAALPATGEDWPARLLEGLSRLYLLAEGFERYDALSPEIQADIRAVLGWPPDEAEPGAYPPIHDRWIVLGGRLESELAPVPPDEDLLPGFAETSYIYHRSVWVAGENSGAIALIRDTASSIEALNPAFGAGKAFEAELIFRPGSYPLHARFAAPPENYVDGIELLASIGSESSLRTAMSAYSGALACNPWLEVFPLALAGVIPVRQGKGWIVVADDGALPLEPRFSGGWHLLALSGGSPIALFGEWDGLSLLPLSMWAEDRFFAFKG